MEIGARCRLGAEIAMSPIDHVQIDGEDAPLRPERLRQYRDPGFQALADEAADRKQEQAARRLLADGAGAAQPPAPLIGLHRAVYRAPVETVMGTEFLIFRSDHGAPERRRNAIPIDPLVMRAVSLEPRRQHLRRAGNGHRTEHKQQECGQRHDKDECCEKNSLHPTEQHDPPGRALSPHPNASWRLNNLRQSVLRLAPVYWLGARFCHMRAAHDQQPTPASAWVVMLRECAAPK